MSQALPFPVTQAWGQPLQEKIRRRQRFQAGKLDLEVGAGIAIDVAGNNSPVAGGTSQVLLEPAQASMVGR